MDKSELLQKLQEEQQLWESFLDQIGSSRMEKPGVNGDWSMKDLVAHLTAWNRWLVIRMQAALRGDPQPLPNWPANLTSDSEINAWIYASYRDLPLKDVLAESRQVYEQLLAVISKMPNDVRIEKIEPRYYLLWVGGTRFEASEFYDHFYDDHQPDVRAWMAKEV